MTEAKPGTPVWELSAEERRIHLGRISAKYPKAVGGAMSSAMKETLAQDPKKIEDVYRGATGVLPAPEEEHCG